MAFRNKLGKLMSIHPMSFIIVQNERGHVDRYIHTSYMLDSNIDHSKQFFLFQINPDLFNKTLTNKTSNLILTKNYIKIYDTLRAKSDLHKEYFTEEYKDDESGMTTECEGYYTTINSDNNHGFGSDYIKVIMNLEAYEGNNIKSTERLIFPRVIYLGLNMTCAEAHMLIFEYFSKLLNKKNENIERIFKRIFKTMDTDLNNDSLEFQIKEEYPYRIRIKNICKGTKQPCLVCSNSDCINCLLPYSSSIKLKDILDRFPKVNDKLVDNSYYYLTDQQRKEINNIELKFILTWLPEYKEIFQELNTKRDHFFTLNFKQEDKHVSLYECLKKFGQYEDLDSSNEWFCTICKKHQKAGKKIEIYKTPYILILHLKRFKQHKITNLVEFPIHSLLLDDVVLSHEAGLIYDLIAVANHSGSLDYGHYYAYCKNPITKKWYKFDDSNIIPISNINDIVTNSAYMLIYRRKDMENMIDLQETYMRGFINYSNVVGAAKIC
jgi:hypothetical protein